MPAKVQALAVQHVRGGYAVAGHTRCWGMPAKVQALAVQYVRGGYAVAGHARCRGMPAKVQAFDLQYATHKKFLRKYRNFLGFGPHKTIGTKRMYFCRYFTPNGAKHLKKMYFCRLSHRTQGTGGCG
ncbi:hypothetical protein B9T62_00110 [Paenibacillus donghaensis]|uniref:Uncharacterized protein n=1 Tax=Paenibacillus donghaensis TaxID=414771 RepID=A0A2Z2K853_9BACL|nr:hypothetical protein B9T62_00110 [Paenibacillus donghaensis]